jgi:hypothetical protein
MASAAAVLRQKDAEEVSSPSAVGIPCQIALMKSIALLRQHQVLTTVTRWYLRGGMG